MKREGKFRIIDLRGVEKLKDTLNEFCNRIPPLLAKPLVLPYETVYFGRKWFFARESKFPPVPLISVGNLSFGGTGKTPLVLYIAEFLLSFGILPAIVSRNYRGSSKSTLHVTLKLSPEKVGDEPYMLKRLCPKAIVISTRNKKEGIELALRKGAKALILDDGFQFWSYKKDLNILTFNPISVFPKNTPPLGTLRSPLTELKEADVIVITNHNLANAEEITFLIDLIAEHWEDKLVIKTDTEVDKIYEAYTGNDLRVESLRKKRGLSFCGLGEPKGFIRLIEKLGLWGDAVLLPDHFSYPERSWFWELVRKGEYSYAITTEKDGVKLSKNHLKKLPPLLFLKTKTVIHEGRELKNRILSLFNQFQRVF